MFIRLKYRLKKKYGWACIDKDVEKHLPEGEGMVVITSLGSTSSIILIENDPNLIQDLFSTLDELFPFNKDYKHHLTWNDDNGSSHLRATYLGQSLVLSFSNKKLIKGTWQNIILINHDTRDREREVILNIISK